jgi:hypothetical protein
MTEKDHFADIYRLITELDHSTVTDHLITEKDHFADIEPLITE